MNQEFDMTIDEENVIAECDLRNAVTEAVCDALTDSLLRRNIRPLIGEPFTQLYDSLRRYVMACIEQGVYVRELTAEQTDCDTLVVGE